MTEPGVETLLTPPEAAKRLAISERTLWSITSPRGPLPCVRIRRNVRYDPDDIRRYVESVREAGGDG